MEWWLWGDVRIGAQGIGALLWLDTVRRIRRGGTTWNDNLVAAVASVAAAWAWLPPWPGWAWPIQLWAAAGMWALFRRLDLGAPAPAWERALLLWPSQVAFAAAFWGWPLVGPLSASGLRPGQVAAAGALPILPALWGVIHTLRGDRVRRFAVPGLPIRIAQLSDIHASGLTHRAEIAAMVRAVNWERPDLVVITGDHLMPFSERDHDWMIEELQRIEAPVRMCAGNHDLPVLEGLRAECRAAGVPLLVDERELLTLGPGRARIEVAGVGFWWRGVGDHLRAALEAMGGDGQGGGQDRAAFRVLLAHDPRVGALLPPGRFDLVLSGHTHGGQLGLEMLGIGWSPLGALGVRDHGWFPAGGRARAHYVHAGNWRLAMPPRMGVAPEIAVFEPG